MALKIGTEDKKKVAIAAGLGVAVLGLVIYNVISMFSGGSTPAPVTAPTVVTAPATAPAPVPANAGLRSRQRVVSTSGHEAAKIPGSMANLDPTLHPEVMAEAESVVYSGKGRNIFSMFSVPVIEEAKAPIRPQQVVPVVTGPPPPPPIDLKFFGTVTDPGGKRQAFLLHGDDVFLASDGEIVQRKYKVISISANSVLVEDMANNNRQTLPLLAR